MNRSSEMKWSDSWAINNLQLTIEDKDIVNKHKPAIKERNGAYE